MFNVQASSLAGSKPASQVRRISQRAFWLLFIVEGLFIAGILFLVLYLLLPVRAPLAQTPDYATVRSAILARLNGSVADPPLDLPSGASAALSSVSGFTLNGYTYYYYREGQPGFDPLSRGMLEQNQVEQVSREQVGRDIIVIYRVISKDRATN